MGVDWGIIALIMGVSFIIKMGFGLNQWFREDIAPDGFKSVEARVAKRHLEGKPNYARIEMLERELFPEWFKDDKAFPTASRSLYVRPAEYDEIERANIVNAALRAGMIRTNRPEYYVPQEYEYVTYDGTGRVVQIYDTRPKALIEPGVFYK